MKNKKNHRTLCRICLDYHGKKCISLFENYKDSVIADHINALADLQITINDGMPRKICPSCLLELGNAIDFKEKCQRSNKILAGSPLAESGSLEVEISDLQEITVKKEDEKQETIETLNDSELFDCLDFYQTEEFDPTPLVEAVAPKNRAIDLKLVCHDCGNLFKSKCKLRVHWKKVHLPKSLICKDCKRAFKSYKAFHRHKKEKTLACVIAGSEQVLIEGEGRSRTFYCKECDYKSFRIKDIQTHLVTHSGDKPYQCDMCPSAYTQLCALQAHKETAHNEYRVQITCHFCGKMIKGRRRVYRHLKMHTENKVQCEICKKIFKNKKSLLTHMKRHGGVKNHTCETCSVAFYTTAELCNHRRMVHNKGKHWFHCNLCEFKSVRSQSVRKHQFRHSEGNFPCTVCGRFLENNQKLILHQKRHFEEKKYSCSYCNLKFFRKDSVRTHVIRKHRRKNEGVPGPIEVAKQEITDSEPVIVKQETILAKCVDGQEKIEIEFSPNIT